MSCFGGRLDAHYAAARAWDERGRSARPIVAQVIVVENARWEADGARFSGGNEPRCKL